MTIPNKDASCSTKMLSTGEKAQMYKQSQSKLSDGHVREEQQSGQHLRQQCSSQTSGHSQWPVSSTMQQAHSDSINMSNLRNEKELLNLENSCQKDGSSFSYSEDSAMNLICSLDIEKKRQAEREILNYYSKLWDKKRQAIIEFITGQVLFQNEIINIGCPKEYKSEENINEIDCTEPFSNSQDLLAVCEESYRYCMLESNNNAQKTIESIYHSGEAHYPLVCIVEAEAKHWQIDKEWRTPMKKKRTNSKARSWGVKKKQKVEIKQESDKTKKDLLGFSGIRGNKDEKKMLKPECELKRRGREEKADAMEGSKKNMSHVDEQNAIAPRVHKHGSRYTSSCLAKLQKSIDTADSIKASKENASRDGHGKDHRAKKQLGRGVYQSLLEVRGRKRFSRKTMQVKEQNLEKSSLHPSEVNVQQGKNKKWNKIEKMQEKRDVSQPSVDHNLEIKQRKAHKIKAENKQPPTAAHMKSVAKQRKTKQARKQDVRYQTYIPSEDGSGSTQWRRSDPPEYKPVLEEKHRHEKEKRANRNRNERLSCTKRVSCSSKFDIEKAEDAIVQRDGMAKGRDQKRFGFDGLASSARTKQKEVKLCKLRKIKNHQSCSFLMDAQQSKREIKESRLISKGQISRSRESDSSADTLNSEQNALEHSGSVGTENKAHQTFIEETLKSKKLADNTLVSRSTVHNMGEVQTGKLGQRTEWDDRDDFSVSELGDETLKAEEEKYITPMGNLDLRKPYQNKNYVPESPSRGKEPSVLSRAPFQSRAQRKMPASSRKLPMKEGEQLQHYPQSQNGKNHIDINLHSDREASLHEQAVGPEPSHFVGQGTFQRLRPPQKPRVYHQYQPLTSIAEPLVDKNGSVEQQGSQDSMEQSLSKNVATNWETPSKKRPHSKHQKKTSQRLPSPLLNQKVWKLVGVHKTNGYVQLTAPSRHKVGSHKNILQYRGQQSHKLNKDTQNASMNNSERRHVPGIGLYNCIRALRETFITICEQSLYQAQCLCRIICPPECGNADYDEDWGEEEAWGEEEWWDAEEPATQLNWGKIDEIALASGNRKQCQQGLKITSWRDSQRKKLRGKH